MDSFLFYRNGKGNIFTKSLIENILLYNKMGTHCFIVIEHKDKTITYIFCHFDGYPSNMIPLLRMYSTRSDVEKLIENGSISYLQEPDKEIKRNHYPTTTLTNRWAFREEWLTNKLVHYYYIFTRENEWQFESNIAMNFDDMIT
jgi:hypothetical protein